MTTKPQSKKINPKDYVATREPVYLPQAVLDILAGRKTVSNAKPKTVQKTLSAKPKTVQKAVSAKVVKPAQGMTQAQYANSKLDLVIQKLKATLENPDLTTADKEKIRIKIAEFEIMKVRLNNQRPGDQ